MDPHGPLKFSPQKCTASHLSWPLVLAQQSPPWQEAGRAIGYLSYCLMVPLSSEKYLHHDYLRVSLISSIAFILFSCHVSYSTKHHKCVTRGWLNHQTTKSWCVFVVQRGRTTMVFLGSLSSRRTHLPPSRMENLNLPKWFRLFPIWAGQETLKGKQNGNRIDVQMSFNFIESSIHY
jgi:hypothetical protein